MIIDSEEEKSGGVVGEEDECGDAEAESVCIQIQVQYKVTLTQSSKSHRSEIVQFQACIKPKDSV